MQPAARHIFALCAVGAVLSGEAVAQQSITAPVGTVTDAVFRANWVGPQADRPEMLGLVPTGEDIKPVEDMATKVREGLWLGSLRIRPGFGAGWAYSNRNSQGQTANANSDQSFFLSPSLGLEYGRSTGPWSISARAGGGYVYYLNPDYSPKAEGPQRSSKATRAWVTAIYSTSLSPPGPTRPTIRCSRATRPAGSRGAT